MGPSNVQHHTFIDSLASERDHGKGPANQFFSLNQVLRLCPWCMPQDLSLPRVVWGTFSSYSAKKELGWIWISPKSSGMRNLGVSCWGCLRPILLVTARQFPAWALFCLEPPCNPNLKICNPLANPIPTPNGHETLSGSPVAALCMNLLVDWGFTEGDLLEIPRFSSGDRFGIIFGSFPNFPPLGGFVFGSFSDYFRLIFGSFFGSFSDRFRIAFGSGSPKHLKRIFKGFASWIPWGGIQEGKIATMQSAQGICPRELSYTSWSLRTKKDENGR